MATLNRFKTFDDTKKVATTSNRFTNFSEPISTPMPVSKPTETPYKSPMSLTYTQPEPIKKGMEAIQKFGEPIQTIVQSPVMQGLKKAGDEVAGVIQKPIQGVIAAGQAVQQAPIKFLNHPVVADTMKEVVKRTSGTGMYSMIQAAGPEKTFQEAYDANKAYQAGDPSKLNQFLYQLGDTAPQTAIGLALNFVPYGGRYLSTAYWTALSAGSELEEKGKITNVGNIGIDVLGDRMLGNSIESLFKAPSKTMWQVIKQTFATEGGTEVAQDLLKYGNDYRSAKTQVEKDAVLAKVKNYFTSGQILMTGLVGGITGAGIGITTKAGQNAANLYKSQTPGERQAGFVKNPFAEDPEKESDTPINQAQTSFNFAQQNLPPDMADIIEPPEKIIMEDKRTPIGQRVGFVDKTRTPWRVLDRMGVRLQYEGLQKATEAYLKEAPKVMDEIKVWIKETDPARKEQIFGALNGENVVLTSAETKTVGEIKKWLSVWADRLGMTKDERITDYITHIFPRENSGEIPEEIALLISKQKKPAGSVYDPFLLHRTGAEGYIRDPWLALQAYAKRAVRKVNMDPALAKMREASDKLTEPRQLAFVEKYIARLNLRPTDLDVEIDNDIKKVLGNLFGARPVHSISTWLRQMIARAKIGGSLTSLAKNLTQGVNTFSELGTRYTIRGYMDLVKLRGKELEEEGVLLTHFVEDQTYSAVKNYAEKFDKVLFANMNATEFINRGAAYYGAKAKFLNEKTTAKEFREALGYDMPKGYSPTLEDAKAYGKFVASKTQFRFGALDTPLFLSSDISKTLGQFQTYNLKQLEFIIEHIHHKDWAKLSRYLFASAMLFQFIGGAFGMTWKDTFPYFKFGYPPVWDFAKDVFGAVVGSKDQYGNVPSLKSRARTVGTSLFTNVMPAGAQIKRSVEGFQAVNQGHSDTAAGNWQYQIDKTPMNYVRGTIFGKANLPEAKDYYAKKAGKTTSSGSALRFKKY